MKILHLNVARHLSPGQTKQLRFEFHAAKQLEVAVWDTLAYHNGPVTEPFVRAIPGLFRSMFMRKLFGWIVALRLSSQYDIVLMRHMTFDPFAPVFGPFIRNRISVHHSKEVAELRLIREGWKGRAASALERFSGRAAARHAVALFGVTREIAEYERDLHSRDKPIGVCPNGINPEHVPVLDDKRDAHAVVAAFICGTFSPWHGLDKLMTAVDAQAGTHHEALPRIHLIGQLSDEQMCQIAATEARRRVFQAHGLMSEEQYRPILAECDVGIASLALERKSLREASTLKVREMLAMGLAVYSGHDDVALPPEEPFVAVVAAPDISGLVAFGMAVKHVPREIVRERSLRRVTKLDSLLGTVTRISEVLAQSRASNSMGS